MLLFLFQLLSSFLSFSTPIFFPLNLYLNTWLYDVEMIPNFFPYKEIAEIAEVSELSQQACSL